MKSTATPGLVSIVIVTRNRRELVLSCLESVYRMDYPEFEVILVDNASTDGTAEAVRNRFPQVAVVAEPTNRGLNGGKNSGQSRAKGEYVLFLDSDTVVDRRLLSELVAAARGNPGTGIVCPKMYYSDRRDTIWYAGSYINLFTSQTKNIGCNEKDGERWNRVRETEFAPTAYLATRAAVERLQGHDETFFMTYGDTDYGWRARENGFKVLFCPSARLWHHLEQEANNRTIRALGYNLPMRAYYFARNRVIFMRKHAPAFKFAVFLCVFFPLVTLYIAYKIVRLGGNRSMLALHLRGSLDGLLFLFTGRVSNRYT